jgi:hypothetical protein
VARTVDGSGFRQSAGNTVGWEQVVPEFLQIALIVAAIGYVLFSRFRGQPLRVRRAAVLPLVLAVLGGVDIAHALPHGLTGADVLFLVGGGLVAFAIGALRGTSVRIYPKDGVLWLRYRGITVAWWVASIAARFGLVAVAGSLGVSAGLSTNSILLVAGLNLLGEGVVALARGAATGVPFAQDNQVRARVLS